MENKDFSKLPFLLF